MDKEKKNGNKMSRDSETVVFTGLPKGEGKDNGVEHIFQETVAETSQNR